MTTRGTFKGNATLTLAAESKWPFTFGLAKARLILQELKAIQTFVAEQDGRPYPNTAQTDPGQLAADRWTESQGGNGGAL